MTSTRARVAAALTVATALTLAPVSIAGASPTSASPAASETTALSPAASLNNASCRGAQPALRLFPADRSRMDKGIITLGSWTVDFRADRWQADHPRVALLTRAFHSSAWLIPDRVEDIEQSVALFVEQARVNPDPGASMSARQLRTRGWVEGHTTWRLKTAMCLYRLASPEQRQTLMPAIDQLIEANLDPRRYYGPPLNPAHNHGLMADRELLNAARHLKREDLAEEAMRRLELQKAEMYDSCGLNYEQASSYQFLHISLWQQLLRRVDIPRFRDRIEATVDRITESSAALAFPDGTIPTIGDGVTRVMDDLSLVSDPVRMWCPETGWSSRRTFRDGIAQQVITRFGPRTGFHGHSDKGSVVWWVGTGESGVPVIVDPGMPSKTKVRLVEQARSAPSHAVFDWQRVSDGSTTARTTQGRAGEIIEISSVRRPWQREITFTPERATLRIEDIVTAASPAGSARSYLPLDPMWETTANPQVFRTDSGWQLRIQCTDRVGARIAQSSDRMRNFQQPAERTAVRVTCSVSDARDGIVATLRVTPPANR